MSVPTDIRVYVNERGVSLPTGSTALDAVRELYPAYADDLVGGQSRLTDSRGLPLAADTVLVTGDILRVVHTRARVEATE